MKSFYKKYERRNALAPLRHCRQDIKATHFTLVRRVETGAFRRRGDLPLRIRPNLTALANSQISLSARLPL
jgi:hypothetical protein